tara:strand:- start:2953 stop:3825 length:873 start_codon:yes stop_codon:yes gene_type:complete
MRRLELLVQEVKDSSDTNDINSYSIYELMRYFNDGQKLIQKILYTANPATAMFRTFKDVTPTTNGVVALPIDIYAKSAIDSVGFIRSGGYFSKLSKVEYAEFSNFYGYAIVDDNILVPEKNTTDTIRVNYVYQLPLLSYRLGKVGSFDDVLKTISIDGASIITDTSFDTRYEYYSVVDKKGVIKTSNLLLDDLVGLSMTFDSESDLSLITVGDYIVCGAKGSSHGLLPDECESFLMTYVQRRIKDKVSSSTASTENVFTTEERQDLEDLFADNSRDQKYPIATDLDFMGI